ncbi:MAG TPA: hypothetical protein VN699_08700 [Pirellulales bacterium]|nr:hypothetical protein [Pirellulales bacterium]
MLMLRNTHRWRRFVAILSLVAFFAANLHGPPGAAAQSSCGMHGGEHATDDADGCSTTHDHARARDPQISAIADVPSASVSCWHCGPCDCSTESGASTRNAPPTGDHSPACPCCPGCTGCCHCSLANVFCNPSIAPAIDLAPSLSQSMVDAAALYTSPSHGRLTPPPKGSS